MTSLLNAMMAEKVSSLLDDPIMDSYPPEQPRFYSRETALGIIHAAIWGHSAREDSTAGAYAGMMLFDTLGLKGWTFDQEEADALQRFRREKAQAKRASFETASTSTTPPEPAP